MTVECVRFLRYAVPVVMVMAATLSGYAAEEDFVCPANTVAGQAGTVPGTPDYTPAYYINDVGLLESGEYPLHFENITLTEEVNICDAHWLGVEVDGEGNDCTATSNEFYVIVVDPAVGLDNPVFAQVGYPTKTVAGTVTVDSKDITVYRYDVAVFDSCGLVPAGEYFLVILSTGTGVDGCHFGWLNTLEGDDVCYSKLGEDDPVEITDNLAFCLTTPVVVEGEIEGEIVVEGEIEGEAVPHPADLNVDFKIKISEAIPYLSGWQRGTNPIAFAIRAAFIWQRGESYVYDSALAPPLCWQLAPVTP